MSRKAERRARLMLARLKLAAEPLPGIEAERLREVLAAEAARPMRGGCAPPTNNSLFGDGHRQRELF